MTVCKFCYENTINGIIIIRATKNIFEKVRKYLFIFTKRTIKIFTINVKIIEIFTLIFRKKTPKYVFSEEKP